MKCSFWKSAAAIRSRNSDHDCTFREQRLRHKCSQATVRACHQNGFAVKFHLFRRRRARKILRAHALNLHHHFFVFRPVIVHFASSVDNKAPGRHWLHRISVVILAGPHPPGPRHNIHVAIVRMRVRAAA